MMNEPDFYWKNFRLGTELQISGTFIYNALNFIDKLEFFHFEEDIFEISYNLSVGIERLEKIVIILIEHQATTDQIKFEKSLITHNLLELMGRIKTRERINLGKVHNKFLMLLSQFYNSHRYNRFNKKSVYEKNLDKFEFINFIKNELKIESEKDDYIKNSSQIKNFLGKIILTISNQLYELVRKYSFKNGIFTYEIRYASKAFKIFISKSYTFEDENNFKKEILISLLNEKLGLNDEFVEYIKTIEPLILTSHNSTHYIKYLLNPDNNQNYLSEYEHLKYEKEIPKDRDEEIEPIGIDHYLSEDLEDSVDFFKDFDLGEDI